MYNGDLEKGLLRLMWLRLIFTAALYLLLSPVWLAAQDSGFKQHDFRAPNGFKQHSFEAPRGFKQHDFRAPSGFKQHSFEAPRGFKQHDFRAPSGFKQNDFGPPRGFKSPSPPLNGFKPPRDFGPASGFKPASGADSSSQPAVDREVVLPDRNNSLKVGRITITGADAITLLRASSPEPARADTAANPPAAVEMDAIAGTKKANGAVSTSPSAPERRASNRETPTLAAQIISAPAPQRDPSRAWQRDLAGWRSWDEDFLFLLAASSLVAFSMFLLFRLFKYPSAKKEQRM